jgi:hypothetical protein
MFAGGITLGEAQEGESLYHQYCASCHGENGLGNGPVAPYLTVKPADLTRISARRDGEFPREQLKRIIAGEELPPGHGTRTMPVWGERLQDDLIGGASKSAIARGRIAFLVDYLQTLQGTGEKGFENTVIPGSTPSGLVSPH